MAPEKEFAQGTFCDEVGALQEAFADSSPVVEAAAEACDWKGLYLDGGAAGAATPTAGR